MLFSADAAADSRGRRLEWLFTHNVNTKTPPGAAEKKKEKQFSAHFHSAELEGWPPIQCCHRRPLPLLAYPPHEREANESQHLSSSRIPPSSFLSGLLWLFPAKHLPYRVGVAFQASCDAMMITGLPSHLLNGSGGFRIVFFRVTFNRSWRVPKTFRKHLESVTCGLLSTGSICNEKGRKNG